MLAPVHRCWGNRVVRESASLAEAGYRVKALMRCESEHITDGVTFIPAPTYRNRLQRFLCLPQVLCTALKERADIYHLHNPDMIPVAIILKLLGKTVIYDTHEDYSQRLLLRAWLPRPLRRPLGYLVSLSERLLSYWVDATLVTQERQLLHFSSRCRLLRNAPVLSEALMERVRAKAATLSRDALPYRLIYAGGLSRARGLFNTLDALQELNEKGFATRLWLLGPELEPCLEEAKLHPSWRYVDYLGLQPHEMVLAHMMRADIGLAVLADEGDHAAARPTKLFEYMACGLPFVASDFPLWREFVAGKGGMWVQPEDFRGLSEVLCILINSQCLRERLAVEASGFVNDFNWAAESSIIFSVYAEILGKKNY
ncbi:glycosyltransferase [Pseudomonas jilinensis]|uniref:Glycosyltransferase subfamily 4-like N-terminal domain-containing protein n=1 Tax=Pseudomonas jilinensis TaxID=2078689 RepID=A0A396RUE4_9PSED|nr:hypothetical protein C2846_15310 [Pseudomonas jilinensis]